jgi:hypothetical protein
VEGSEAHADGEETDAVIPGAVAASSSTGGSSSSGSHASRRTAAAARHASIVLRMLPYLLLQPETDGEAEGLIELPVVALTRTRAVSTIARVMSSLQAMAR